MDGQGHTNPALQPILTESGSGQAQFLLSQPGVGFRQKYVAHTALYS